MARQFNCMKIFLLIIVSVTLITIIFKKDEMKSYGTIGRYPRDWDKTEEETEEKMKVTNEYETVKIAFTCCGESGLEQTFASLKSALIFNRLVKNHIHIIFITDIEQIIIENISHWPSMYLERFTYEMVSPSFPNVTDPNYWKYAYKPCSAQRIFFPLILPHHEAVMHIDTDVLFLSPPSQLWSFFSTFSSTQIAAFASDVMEPEERNYFPNKTIPYVTEFGLNSGVILMNLTRMRQVNFNADMQPILRLWKENLVLFDQDIYNYYFHVHPERLFLLPCRENYLNQHCSKGNYCVSALSDGVAQLHGALKVFHNEKEMAFRAVYETIRDYRWEEDESHRVGLENLLVSMEDHLGKRMQTNCDKTRFIFTKTLKEMLNQ